MAAQDAERAGRRHLDQECPSARICMALAHALFTLFDLRSYLMSLTDSLAKANNNNTGELSLSPEPVVDSC